MSQPRPWTAVQHRPIVRLEENIWTVEGETPVPRGEGPLLRRMTVLRLRDVRLAVHSGVALSEPAMAEIERWGEPAFYVVPNAFHRLDAHGFKTRYPRIKVVCPPGSRKRVAAAVPVDGGYDLLPDELPSRPLPMRTGECVFLIRSGTKLSLLFADGLIHIPRFGGVFGWASRAAGFTGDARLARITKWLMVTNCGQMARIYRDLADLHGLTRLIPGHGDVVEGGVVESGVIEGGAAAVLRRVADGI
jgi:hypothetical protein